MNIKYLLTRNLLRLYPLLKRLAPDKHLPYPVVGGKMYINIKESRMMFARILGLHAVREFEMVQALLKPGMTFLDIGANKGDFSLLAAKIVGSAGKVLAFEPEPNNCYWIKQSIELNDYGNITLYQMALGENDGTATLFLSETSGWHTLLSSRPDRNAGTIEVATHKLDSILHDTEAKKVDMAKIDVEGSELKVLQGAINTLEENPQIVLLIDLHPFLGVKFEEIHDFLTALNFSIFGLDKPQRQITDRHENPKRIIAWRNGHRIVD